MLRRRSDVPARQPPAGVWSCLSDAVLALTEDGRALAWVSPAVERIVGLSAARLAELWPADWCEHHVHPDDRRAVVLFLAGTPSPPAVEPREIEFRARGEAPEQPAAPVDWRWLGARLWRRDGGRGPILVLRDVTAEKLAGAAPLEAQFRALQESLLRKNRDLEGMLEQVRRTQELLVQTRKMEAIGQLAAGLAHNFNNLLTVVIGTLDVLALELPADSPMQCDLVAAQDAALEAADVARKLHSFSHPHTAETRRLDVKELVIGAADLLRPSLPDAIRIECAVAEGLPSIEGDSGRLETALLDLCLNARDAMPNGGALHLAADGLTLDAAYVADHPDARPGPHVRIVVRDTGVGMDAATLGRLFEPFFTTQTSDVHAGLGLATVHATVRAHGGHVTVESEPGRGSTFVLFLPVAAGPGVEPPVQVGAAVRGRGETLLVVDDDPAVLRTTERLLARLGYRVLTASSGAAALECIESGAVPVALVLVDIVMPNTGGLATLRRLRELRPGLPAVLMTGYAGRDFLPPVDLGAEVLSKPLDLDRLARAVRTALDSASPAGTPAGSRSDRRRRRS